jgi:transcriptional regulator with XRE-family HTH domain
MTQKQLAEITGIRPSAISNLCRGFIDRITIDHLERIAKALDIRDINELITIVDE